MSSSSAALSPWISEKIRSFMSRAYQGGEGDPLAPDTMIIMLNWVVVGMGDISTRRVIPALRSEPRSRLHGVVTRDQAKGAGVADQVWNDLSGALADPKVDAVYVATPVAL